MKVLDKIKLLYKTGFNSGTFKVFSFHDCLPDVFSSYIELLMYKRYRILGSAELLDRLTSGPHEANRRQKEAILTCDDGRRNCWTVIFPLLKKYNCKAILFIIPSKIKDTDEYYPNLEDYWNGRVSWENLYLSHRRQPYLSWKELNIMQSSGLVDIFSHSLRHDVVCASSSVIDFQHPGVYEIPVYFEEWLRSRQTPCDDIWGAPIYERLWAPLATNQFIPNQELDSLMNGFVKKNGGFLFFKKKNWRRKLFEYYQSRKKSYAPGRFKKIDDREDARRSIFDSKKIIEEKLKNDCVFFSLPLYQSNPEILALIQEAGYKAVFSGPSSDTSFRGDIRDRKNKLFLFNRIPSFWIKFLTYF